MKLRTTLISIALVISTATLVGCNANDTSDTRSYRREAELILNHFIALLEGEKELSSAEKAAMTAIHGDQPWDDFFEGLSKGYRQQKARGEHEIRIVGYQTIVEKETIDRRFHNNVVSDGSAPIGVFIKEGNGYLGFISGVVRDGEVMLISFHPEPWR